MLTLREKFTIAVLLAAIVVLITLIAMNNWPFPPPDLGL